ncbi:hypothetical protein NPIL_170321 [Nephila pilipes]|uniref:Uncharacterized protein n=1 Tax=Nephila pilipes TaxID=299642 RepID=A0A8X6PHY8_NEPPI|nr:hypothetical protein NPIL_170321 [Nephila pilipes]
MVIVFSDVKCVVLPEFLHIWTISVARYCGILTKISSNIRRKKSVLLSQGFMFLYHNSKPHLPKFTQNQIHCFGWKSVAHLAQTFPSRYSPVP